MRHVLYIDLTGQTFSSIQLILVDFNSQKGDTSYMKRTKIIATFGPAIGTPAKIKRLVKAGVNVFRINCSHGESADFKAAAALIREATKSAKFPIGLLFDISGPKLRLGHFTGEIKGKANQEFILTDGETDLSKNMIAVNHPAIIGSVKTGERVFIDDGKLILHVMHTGKKQITVRLENDGMILPGKGINLPDTDIKIQTITEKDKTDIHTAVAVDADYIALSFVRSGDDIIEAHKLIKKYNGTQKIIAKLEKREAVQSLDTIMLLSDGVMVARGDLGVELPFEELPTLQKKIIAIANQHHKPVIVATQMLESMRFEPRATRAEINDVASAVFDFVDAVMLSAETATGAYPEETVMTMTGIIEATEAQMAPAKPELADHLIRSELTHTIAKAVSKSYTDIQTEMIFAFTTSGFTAALISNLFPPQPVIALSPNKKVLSQLSLYRSVYPVYIKQPDSFQDMLKNVNTICGKFSLAKEGEKVMITGGAPFGSTAPTNFMMIYTIGDKTGLNKRS